MWVVRIIYFINKILLHSCVMHTYKIYYAYTTKSSRRLPFISISFGGWINDFHHSLSEILPHTNSLMGDFYIRFNVFFLWNFNRKTLDFPFWKFFWIRNHWEKIHSIVFMTNYSFEKIGRCAQTTIWMVSGLPSKILSIKYNQCMRW